MPAGRWRPQITASTAAEPSPQWAEPFCLTDMGERSDERIRELYCSVQFNVYTVSYTSPLLQMGGGGPPRAEDGRRRTAPG